jgi:tail tube protein
MATGSGLDAQLGTKTEVTVGTSATPVDHFWPFNSSGLTFDPSYIEGMALQAGQRFKDVSLAGIARKSATGKIEIPIYMQKFGWWCQHLIGSAATPVQISTTTAYKQVHTPAGLKGKSFTCQVGKPEPGTGTVKPTTYNGCKITDWSITWQDNALTLLDMTVDAWNEDGATALATASYTSGNLAYNFSHVNNFTTGGTVTTSAGEASISGGTVVPSVITKLTLEGKYTLATDRYGLGNAGVKKEQLETDFVELTGSFEGEYDSTTWDNPFRNGTTVALEIDSTGPQIGVSGNNFALNVIIPAAKITAAPAEVSGPGLIAVSGTFTVYSDGVNAPIQIKYVSSDTTL